MIRVPGSKVEERHSWNSSHAISSYFLFNLPRHADHHIKATQPYWNLKLRDSAPQLPYGYLNMIIISLIPPLFKKIMHPKLVSWDKEYATEEEKYYIDEANELSLKTR